MEANRYEKKYFVKTYSHLLEIDTKKKKIIPYYLDFLDDTGEIRLVKSGLHGYLVDKFDVNGILGLLFISFLLSLFLNSIVIANILGNKHEILSTISFMFFLLYILIKLVEILVLKRKLLGRSEESKNLLVYANKFMDGVELTKDQYSKLKDNLENKEKHQDVSKDILRKVLDV